MNIESRRKQKITSFTDLEVWKIGHALVLSIYKETSLFPSQEYFGLTSQMRRAAVSITSNIAERFTRESYKEKVLFYTRSLGSLTEIQNQLLIARDVRYTTTQNFNQISKDTIIVQKLLYGLIRKSRTYIHNS